jgi:hypothetical protein
LLEEYAIAPAGKKNDIKTAINLTLKIAEIRGKKLNFKKIQAEWNKQKESDVLRLAYQDLPKEYINTQSREQLLKTLAPFVEYYTKPEDRANVKEKIYQTIKPFLGAAEYAYNGKSVYAGLMAVLFMIDPKLSGMITSKIK